MLPKYLISQVSVCAPFTSRSRLHTHAQRTALIHPNPYRTSNRPTSPTELNGIEFRMCYKIHATHTRFPHCTQKYTRDCLLLDPEQDYIQWCGRAEERGRICAVVVSTSMGSSTKRRVNCPRHRGVSSLQLPGFIRKDFGTWGKGVCIRAGA